MDLLPRNLGPTGVCTATFMPRVRRFLSHLRHGSDWRAARAPTGLSGSSLCWPARHYVPPVASAMLDSHCRPYFTFSPSDNSCSCHTPLSRTITSLECVAKLVPVPPIVWAPGFPRVPLPHPRLFRLSQGTSPHKCVSYIPLLLCAGYADLQEHRSTEFPLYIFTKLY
jgi:hypothetical protein